MLIATLKDRKIAISFCHPKIKVMVESHDLIDQKGDPILIESGDIMRKTICELFEVELGAKDTRGRKWLCSKTKEWKFKNDHKFSIGKGPKEILRLETLAGAVAKVSGLTKEDKEIIFDTYLNRFLPTGGSTPVESNGSSSLLGLVAANVEISAGVGEGEVIH